MGGFGRRGGRFGSGRIGEAIELERRQNGRIDPGGNLEKRGMVGRLKKRRGGRGKPQKRATRIREREKKGGRRRRTWEEDEVVEEGRRRNEWGNLKAE